MAGKTVKVASGRVVSICVGQVGIFRNTRRSGRYYYQVKHSEGREKPCLQVEDAASFFRDEDFADRVVHAFKLEQPTPREIRMLFPGFGVVYENKRGRSPRNRR